MKLKYKKVILLTMMSTMGIGLLTLSIAPNKNETKESVKIVNGDEATVLANTNPDTDKVEAANTEIFALTNNATPTLMPSPSPSPSPTPLPVYELEDEGYPEIDALMKQYYDAKLNCDVDAMKKIMSDSTNISSKKVMQEDVKFVEEYQNIKNYVKKGFKEGTYIVYTYNEIKYLNIKTPAPAVKKFFLATNDAGELKIYSGIYDDQTVEYYKSRDNDADVQKLIEDTNNKGDEAKKNDEYLKIFWESLDKKQNKTETENE